MATLQASGVAAGVVRVPMDLDRDPHLDGPRLLAPA